MEVAITSEHRELIEGIQSELNNIKHEVIELSIQFYIQLKSILLQFLISYKEYSFTNIKEYGMTEILMNRANRFFKLEQEFEGPIKKRKSPRKKKFFKKQNKTQGSTLSTNRNKSIRKERGHIKLSVRKISKYILFPFYLCLVAIGILLKSKDNKKKDKNVKNTYSPY